MCRHLAYLGSPLSLADCFLYQSHSLLHQSWAPMDMRGGGTVNADGFGIGWLVDFPDSTDTPDIRDKPNKSDEPDEPDEPGAPHAVRRALRYRRDCPIWSDSCLPDLAASITSGAILAAVRSATAGMPVTATACAPFVERDWMFSHNGVVAGWPDSVEKLAGSLPPAALMTLEAPTDSAFLWALVRERLREGQPGAPALAAVTAEVMARAPGSRLNLLLHDGEHISATTVGHSLWVRQHGGDLTVSSEPLISAPPPNGASSADEGWRPVPDLCLLEASATGCSILPLML